MSGGVEKEKIVTVDMTTEQIAEYERKAKKEKDIIMKQVSMCMCMCVYVKYSTFFE